MESLNKLLGVRVIGFKKKFFFCPKPPQNGQFVRAGMKTGIGSRATSTGDWRKHAGDTTKTVTAP